jgi:hypothetical protein
MFQLLSKILDKKKLFVIISFIKIINGTLRRGELGSGSNALIIVCKQL